MGDAEIIPIGTRGRPGRGTGRQRPSAAARDLSGDPAPAANAVPNQRGATTGSSGSTASSKPAASSAPGRARKSASKTPKQPVREPAAKAADREREAATRPAPTEASETLTPPSGDRTRAAATTEERGPLAGIPVSDWWQAIQSAALELFGRDWEAQLARMLAFWRRRLAGEYDVDDYGFDPEFTQLFVLTVLRPIAEKWFRIEPRGLENIPAEGGALLVSNHSGTLPVDAVMTVSTVYERTGRSLRPLSADLVFRLPMVSALARKTGATLACNEDAERMLRGGELVGVWPEGFKGIGKPYSERYKLQRFGRGGFVSAAMRTGVPIVPLSVVGAEEIYPMVGNLSMLARILGVPYVPVTPTFPLLGPLGLVPLPSKWLMEFGEPIRTDSFEPGAADDPMLVFNVTDQVRETIQQTLYTLLRERESVFG